VSRPLRRGDRVRVLDGAPAAHHPGVIGVIVDLRRLDDEGAGCRQTPTPDAPIATLALPNGRQIDVPGHLLLPAPCPSTA
jgi:hypothetical protein